ncbi:MAG: hypothetical protein N3E49_04210 [Bacteroidia bacterium]|nr:hypothetical protein [Bacteroidia bacterium]
MKCQTLQVCAWRIKYLITLSSPLEAHQWKQIEQNWVGSRLERFPLSIGGVLYKLTLPERVGTLTGSSHSPDIYAVLLRVQSKSLLAQVQDHIERALQENL